MVPWDWFSEVSEQRVLVVSQPMTFEGPNYSLNTKNKPLSAVVVHRTGALEPGLPESVVLVSATTPNWNGGEDIHSIGGVNPLSGSRVFHSRREEFPAHSFPERT